MNERTNERRNEGRSSCTFFETAGLNGLELLDLSFNKLKEVPSTALRPTAHLKDLLLGGNEIADVREAALANLTHLRRLDLSHSTQLTSLAAGAFRGLDNLISLNMSRCTSERSSFFSFFFIFVSSMPSRLTPTLTNSNAALSVQNCTSSARTPSPSCRA